MNNNKFVGKVGVGEILTYVVLILVLVFTVMPLLFMVTAAFMDAKQIMAMPYSWIPSKEYFTTESRTFFTNFQKAIVGNHNDHIFFRNLWNSLIVAFTCALTTVLLASLCGYGLAKFNFKGKTVVFMAIMSTMMIPFEAIMIPLYLVASKLKIINTIPGLIIPFLVSAFGVFQMRQYLITFPSEYLDAARVDGLTEFGIYARIVLPNSTRSSRLDRPNSSSSSRLLTRALSPNSSRSAAKASITSHLPLKTVLPTLWLKWKAKACASSTKLLAKAPKV